MTQTEKDLLLKDLCTRLPYGVKCQIQEDKHIHIGTLCRIEFDNKNGHLLDFVESINYLDCQFYISEVKPYLFPMSSMTKEQYNQYIKYSVYEGLDWLNKNHFDYRGLIPMGLAIDATGLNVY